MNRNALRVACLVFGSGWCALVYQTAWLRDFRLIFGATTPASAAVVAIFMGGLGLGSALLGRRSEGKTRPLLFYGQLELLIALSAAMTPWLVSWVRAIYVATGGTPSLGPGIATVLRLGLSALVLGVPTFLMGGTLPAAARAIESEEDVGRRRLALLYGANTLGAVAGAWLATFFLLEHLGNRSTLWLASGANVLVAMLAILYARALPQVEVPPATSLPLAGSVSPAGPGFALPAAALVGFAFFLMELVWFRLLSPLLGGTAFTFGLILAVALFGIGLGGIIYALSAANRGASLRGFALTCTLEAVCLAVPFALGDRVAILAALLRPLGSFAFAGHIAAWTLVTALVVLPAAIVAGFQFPLLIGLLGRGARDVGRHTGQAYGWNTLGAMVGALAGGFGILPLLTAPGTWRLVITLLVLLGLWAWILSLRRTSGGSSSVVVIASALAAVGLLSASGPTAAWRHTPIGAGRVALSNFASRNDVQDWLHGARLGIAWEAEGREASVALDKEAGYSFLVNGKSDDNARDDAGTQVMAGLVAAALHPHPRQAFVVGLGTGSTAGWLGAVPSIERVDVVELEPAILKVAAACTAVNHDVMHNARVHIIIGDGREVLLTTPTRYDLIVSEPSNLYRVGVAALYTQDFYRVAASKLNADGIFLQWVQGYETDLVTLETIFRTLTSVFPSVEVWHTKVADLTFVASRRPIAYDVARLRQRVQEEPVKVASARVWCATDLEGFLAHYVATDSFARWLASRAGGDLNTDNRMVLEFAFGRSLGISRGRYLETLSRAAFALGQSRPTLTNGPFDWHLWREERSAGLVVEDLSPPVPRLDASLKNRSLAQEAYVEKNFDAALDYWNRQPQKPRTLMDVTMMAELYALAGREEALPLLERVRAVQPVEAHAILARLRWEKQDVTNAVAALESAFVGYRNDPWPKTRLMRRALALAGEAAAKVPQDLAVRLYRALEKPFAVSCEEDSRRSTRFDIAEIVEKEKFGQLTLEALADYEPHVPWEKEFLERRSQCYSSLHHPWAKAAASDLRLFLRNEPAVIDMDEAESTTNPLPGDHPNP